MALSEDIQAICGTTIQLRWANLLKRLGLFERWKKKGKTVQDVINRQKKELEALYKESTPGTQTSTV
jgi:hypothetical protein